MRRDFTRSAYAGLLQAARDGGYRFQAFEDFIADRATASRTIILRHDVDARPRYALAMARLESDHGVRGTYYFRTIPATFSPAAIRTIRHLGHEVGYHYEDLAASGGDTGKAIRSFETNLRRLRALVPIRTICMHGSPLSRWDNRDLWKVYDYRSYDLHGEPYFDVDFQRTAYVTDTGRAWNSARAVVRDRVASAWRSGFRSTDEFAGALRTGRLPAQIMITLHPQRWTDSHLPWAVELVSQNLKNVAKVGLNGIRR